ncbi:uncharacterized protein N7482_001338 [Penicillium canariense]|uniref:Uncharacterized protein n=1 Tax=Penicillium canariense TaxID=189055 RepID=A0A9W9LSZ8_9EURO|nr:uncharacterized protein N7482_001338 [Penicillium canariense]KAJ5175461.1 hypothetical protein N7482_001338 [Penicillium canariense]
MIEVKNSVTSRGREDAKRKALLGLIEKLQNSGILHRLQEEAEVKTTKHKPESNDLETLKALSRRPTQIFKSLEVTSTTVLPGKRELKILDSLSQKQQVQLDLEFSGNSIDSITCFVVCSISSLQRDLQAVGNGATKQDAKNNAFQLLISKLQEAGLWEQLSQRDQVTLNVDDDLLYMMRFGTKSLLDANDKLRSVMTIEKKRPLLSQRGPDVPKEYKTKRSEKLTEALRKFRQSQDPKVVAIRSATGGLPVNECKESVLDLVKSNTYSIIVGETGSGKSTQVPQIILNDAIEDGYGGYCNILCIQPRRIAARMLAQRVAHERDEKIGSTVGYMIRFGIKRPAKGGAITYCTTGLALNLLQKEPDLLNSFSHIILDEVHVRDIDIDFVMMLLKSHIDRCQVVGTPTPKIVVMSATVDVDLFASYFRNRGPDGQLSPAPHICIPGRQFHVNRHYLDEILTTLTETFHEGVLSWCLKEPMTQKFLRRHSHNFSAVEIVDHGEVLPTEEEAAKVPSSPHPISLKQEDDGSIVPIGLVAVIIHHILSTTETGSVLVFLPGLSQILAVESQLLSAAEMLGLDVSDENTFKILKLHASLPEELAKLDLEMPRGCRRILLATDVAEASLTIPDVKYVIDSGKVNQLMYDSPSRSHRIACCWASQSSSVQRSGRAGRVQDGEYFFLGSKQCFDSLRITKSPEILRSDLQNVCVRAKISNPDMPINESLQQAIESPDSSDVALAIDSLKQLRALDNEEELTNLGSLVNRMPALSPHLAKLVILGATFRCLDPLLILATLGEEPSLFFRTTDPEQRRQARDDQAEFAGQSFSDHFSVITAFKAVRSVWNSQGWRAAHRFAISQNVYLPVYREAFLTCNQILHQLEQAKVVNKWLLTDEDADGQFGGAKLNINSHHVPLIKALLLHCLYPRLAAPKPGSKTAFTTQTEDHAMLYPWSMAMNGKLPPRDLLVFNRKFPFANTMALKEASAVTPLAANLFGGRLTVQQSSIVMDSWLQTGIRAKDSSIMTAEVIKDMVELSKVLDKALATAFDSCIDDTRVLRMKRATFFTTRDHFIQTLQQTVKDILDRDRDHPIRGTSVPAAWTDHDLSKYSD